jgi:hypothetical protein
LKAEEPVVVARATKYGGTRVWERVGDIVWERRRRGERGGASIHLFLREAALKLAASTNGPLEAARVTNRL